MYPFAGSAKRLLALISTRPLPVQISLAATRYCSSVKTVQEIDALLSNTTWSVKALSAEGARMADVPSITPKQLQHLINLSALPEPRDDAEAAKILDTLRSQLHFVRAIQDVDTKGVAPLRTIRDETLVAEEEISISVESLKGALGEEEVHGKHHRRIRRNAKPVDTKGAEDWDVLAHAERKAGRYFLVDTAKV